MSIFAWLKGVFSKMLKVIKPILQAAFNTAMQEALKLLKDIIIEAIKKAAATGVSDSDKRQQVFTAVRSYAIGKGIEVKDRYINLAIETVYNALKNKGEIK